MSAIRERVTEWFERMAALDQAWEGWRELGVDVEAPFPDAAWRMATAYSQSVEREIGTWPNGWLEYYWFEARNMAGKARVCMKGEGRIHGAVLIPEGDREYVLTNLESLIQFLEAEYGGPK